MNQTNQDESHRPVHHLNVSVASDLYDRVQRAARTAGIKTAPWLRQMIRHIAITDCPASWQEAGPRERSHDSRAYGKRFMMRLDDPPWEKIEDLSTHLKKSIAEIIRQLVAQATLDDFTQAWQTFGGARRTHLQREPPTQRRQP